MTATRTAAPAAGARGAPLHRGGTLTGTGTLVRFLLRRDRVRLPVWVAGLGLTTVATAVSFTDLYPTTADRQTLAATLDTPAGVAMTGVDYSAGDYTYGVMMGHQMLWFTALLAGLMSVLLVVRHTRAEEATGRAELVRAGVVGRHAMTAAALSLVAVANGALAAVLAVGLGATGVDGITWGGSALYGAAHAAVGLVFAGVAIVTVQITEHPRAASGLAIATIGLAYALRAIGDVGDGTLSWLSPLGWAQATQVYANDRWWALLPAVVVTAGLVAAGVTLSNRRDVGAGIRPPRRGAPAASDALTHPLGFALRLHRAGLIGWSLGLFVLGVMYGSVLGETEQMLTQIEAMQDLLPEIAGVDVAETFASMITTIMAIIASVYAILAALKMRSEESAGRAEPVLATGLSRTRWAASHLAVAMVGGVVVLLAGGLGLGATGAASTGDASLLPNLLGAAIAYAPALWVAVGIVAALYGLAPRAILLTWVVVVYGFVVVYLGGILQFPGWMSNLSPFGHVPQLPAADLTLVPLLGLAAVAAALTATGLAAFRRRDLQSAT